MSRFHMALLITANCFRRNRFSAASAGVGRRERRRKCMASCRSVSSVQMRGMRVWRRGGHRVIAKMFL